MDDRNSLPHHDEFAKVDDAPAQEPEKLKLARWRRTRKYALPAAGALVIAVLTVANVHLLQRVEDTQSEVYDLSTRLDGKAGEIEELKSAVDELRGDMPDKPSPLASFNEDMDRRELERKIRAVDSRLDSVCSLSGGQVCP